METLKKLSERALSDKEFVHGVKDKVGPWNRKRVFTKYTGLCNYI